MAAKRVLLLSDDKPGHFQLAEGIVAALNRPPPGAAAAQRPAWTATRLPVSRPWWQPTRAWSTLSNNRSIAPARALSVLSGTTAPELNAIGPFQLVVSAGGDTLAANVAATRMYRCSNVFYGSLRRYRVENFSLVLTSYAAQVQHANQAMTLKPSAFDPDALRAPNTSWRFGTGEPLVLGLLIGGDSGTVRFDDTDWAALLDLLGEDHLARPRWVVANSRRTPGPISDRLAQLARNSNHVEFVDVRAQGAGTLLHLLDRSDAIVVSIDSSSMVSEAVWSRRPVVVVAPKIANLPPLEQDYRADLARQSLITTRELNGVTVDGVLAAFQRVAPLGHNPLDELSRLISARLPDLFRAD